MKRLFSYKKLWLCLLASLILGIILTLLDGKQNWINGWIAYSLLCATGLGSIFGLHHLLSTSFPAERIALVAFSVRLFVGVLLMFLLPVYGYQDENAEVTKAGYVFYDAFIRDGQAWRLSVSSASPGTAFTGAYSGDQYGGLLALSATVYRYLSPDARRPILILLLTSTISAWGVLFLYKAAHAWFSEKIALLVIWIFALYPESVLLGSSQMREPFVITGVAMALYALTEMQKTRIKWLVWLALAGMLLFIFQPPMALATFIGLFGLWLSEPNRKISWKRVLLFVGIILVGVLIVYTIWADLPSLRHAAPNNVFFTWLEHNFNFQAYLTRKASGTIQKLIRSVGKQWSLLIMLGYGVTRPVLPAALADFSGLWIWRIINIIRSAGWYALLPILIYGLFSSFRVPTLERRAQLVWASIFIWIWILISAANGGADLWDNPRYRTIFLGLEALLAAWALEWARKHHDPWLSRLLSVELACVLVFTEWYITRTYLTYLHPDIRLVIGLCLILIVLVVGGGWLLDRKKRNIIRPVQTSVREE